MSGLEWI